MIIIIFQRVNPVKAHVSSIPPYTCIFLSYLSSPLVQLVCHTRTLSLLSLSCFCCSFSTKTGSIAQVELLNKIHEWLKFTMMK